MSDMTERLLQLQKTCGDLTDRLDEQKLISQRLGEAAERYSEMVADYEKVLKLYATKYVMAMRSDELDVSKVEYKPGRGFTYLTGKAAREVLEKWKNR